jgi:hypothetical protein
MAFARAEIAADTDPVPLPQRQHGDRPIDPEVPGLLVMPRPLVGVSGRVEYWSEIQPPIRLDTFTAQDIPAVRQQMPDWLGRRVELAHSLFHLALAQANPELKYILFITAVEALVPDDRGLREDEVVRLLDLLCDQANNAEGFAGRILTGPRELIHGE